jgi:D-lactate dehydrogenase
MQGRGTGRAGTGKNKLKRKKIIMNQPRIAFFDTKPYDQEYFTRLNEQFNYEITWFKNHLRPETAVLAEGHNVVCAFVNDVVDRDVISVLKKKGVRLLAMRCAGYSNVDLEVLDEAIRMVRVPDYSPHAVAEHAVAMMLSLNRKIHRAFYRTLDNNFNINGLLGFDMYGKTAGIIGTGKIGKSVIRILKGFGMKILAHDLYPDREFEKELGFAYADLETIYRESDIISLHCPLNRESWHMINRESLHLMKDSVMLINTGRGKLIDTADLISALKKKKIGSAGLDVYEEESEYFYEDFSSEVIGDDILARLLTFPNVLVTSHLGFFTREALTGIAQTTFNNIRDFFDGKPLKNEVCKKCG